jgi:predicted PurR-regulated permease PerM
MATAQTTDRQQEFRRIQTIAFFAVLIAVGVLFYRVIAPYVMPIFWAAVIASLFHPLYTRLFDWTKKASFSAALTVGVVIVVVILPLAGVIGLVVDQAISTYNYVTDPATVSMAQSQIDEITAQPLIQQYAEQLDLRDRLQSGASALAGAGVGWLTAGSRSTLQWILSVFIMLYSLFYFLKDGPQWLKRFMMLLPFGDDNEAVIYKKFASTARATLKGTFLIGVVQGILGGVFLWIVGVPSSAFWGLIMILLSIIPAVGPALILIPVTIFFAVTMIWWKVGVMVVALLVIGLIDNVLRPPLVGKDLQMHPVLILFATIGGIGMFGISGVVIGPMIAAFLFALLQMYEVKYKKELTREG